MATTLLLRFPGRRYHATPWRHHVNEGVVEWPPSPWRLLRGLLAVGFTKHRWPEAGPPAEARALIEALAGVAPSFRLPPVSLAHSRHYMPAGKQALVLDAWANVEDGVVAVTWPVALDAAQRALLAALAADLGYLGRAESWVEAELAPEGAPLPTGRDCAPLIGTPLPGHVSAPVLSPMPAGDYAAWRAVAVAPIEEKFAVAPAKKRSAKQQEAHEKERGKALSAFPADLVAALCVETSALQAHGWSAPPGSTERSYALRSDATAVSVPPERRRPKGPTVPFALLAFSTASRGTSALPAPERAFPQGRLLHRAVAAVIGQRFDRDPALAEALLGQTAEGPAAHDHQHAHLLHLDLGGSGRLDHALIWAPCGLTADAQAALGALRKTYTKGGADALQVAFAGAGDAALLRGLPAPYGEALAETLGPPGGAQHWISATPYVAPRMLKRRGKDSLEGLIDGELRRRGLPGLASLEVLPPQDERARRLRHAVLHDRDHSPPHPTRFALRLQLEAPAEGPICLGYGAHVGLGRFITER
jgi:CRISPR-associated protein Csb2